MDNPPLSNFLNSVLTRFKEIANWKKINFTHPYL
jgi:hypothetical protein